ncbi:MAG TPA: oligosaccharide flippase family protein [Anaerolineaceae bacterium]
MNLLRNWRQDNILRRVVRNSSYLFVSYALGAVLTLVTARLLGAADFGILGTITVFSSNINRLFSFRMGEMVVKYMGESLAHNDHVRAAASVKAAMLVEAITSLVAFGALAVLAPIGAAYVVHDATTAPLFLLYGVSILANLINETSTGILQVTNHYRSQALINFLQTVLVAILLGMAAIHHSDLLTVLWIYLIGKMILGMGPALVAFYWLPRALGKDWWRAPLSVLPPWREVARFSISTNFNGTVNMIARDNEVPIVSFFFGSAAAGYFKMALALINLIVTPINPFISTTYPEITRTIASREWQKLRSLLQRVTLISTVWTGLVIVTLVAGHEILFERFTLFGRTIKLLVDYGPAYPALMILMVGYGVANIFFWNRPLLLAQGQAGFPFLVSLWGMIAKVALMLLVLSRTNYLVEAVLLSAYLAGTVGINVLYGLRRVNREEGKAALQRQTT